MKKKTAPAVDAKELVQAAPNYYVSRVAGKQITLRGITFTIQVLTSNMFAYLLARGEEYPEVQFIEAFRLGVKKIEGLNYEDGSAFPITFDEIEVYGRKIQAISLDVVDVLPVDMVGTISQEIRNLSEYEQPEKNKLDFTTP